MYVSVVYIYQDRRQSFIKGDSNAGVRARYLKRLLLLMTVLMNMISAIVTISFLIFL